ncbi:hypothetical protein CCZ01_02510 [Helicobacter monodelphidis]|uniref:hypothetical protein n=1 Tax=Helicobacter sp. 15-1451 TaxID=2004995 RepID=UPI000DCAF5F3|nr:hypothetical protein [Helicobacter sp. 15-1451]RAX58673.1 hypothetical protein CCZ01_02510 [Helicobacter sp. 15-1451]
MKNLYSFGLFEAIIALLLLSAIVLLLPLFQRNEQESQSLVSSKEILFIADSTLNQIAENISNAQSPITPPPFNQPPFSLSYKISPIKHHPTTIYKIEAFITKDKRLLSVLTTYSTTIQKEFL